MSAQQRVPNDTDPASARMRALLDANEATVAEKDPIPTWKAAFDQLFKKSMSSLKTSIDALPDGEGALDTYRRKRLLGEVTTDEVTTDGDPASAEATVADKDPIPPWKAEFDVVFKKARRS